MPTFEELNHQAAMRMAANGGQEADGGLGRASRDLRQAATAIEGNSRMEMQANAQTGGMIQSLTSQLQQLLMEIRSERVTRGSTPTPAPIPAAGQNTMMQQMSSWAGGAASGAAAMGGAVAWGVGAGLGAIGTGVGYASAQVPTIQAMVADNMYRMTNQPMFSPQAGGYVHHRASSAGGALEMMNAAVFDDDMIRGGVMRDDRARAYMHGSALIAGARVGAGVQGIAGMLSARSIFGNAGSMLGGAAFGMPGAYAGGIAGSTVGAAFDVFNPVSWGSDQLSGMMRGSGIARALSADMLRGQGSNRMRATTAMGMGQSINRAGLADMDFRSDQVQDITMRLGEAGFFRGASDEREFESRLKRELNSLKGIMRTMRMTRDEAIKAMVEIQSDMGFSSPQGRMMLANSVYGAAQVAGVSTSTAMQYTRDMARSTSSAGMMASTGAMLAPGAMALGGMSAAYGNVDPRLLASVGGQRGLTQLIGRSQQSFLQGNLGTLMAAGGAFSDVDRGMTQAAGGLQGSGDLLNFMAGRHRRVDKVVQGLGTQGVAASQAMQLANIADRMGITDPRQKKSAMILLAVQMGMASNPQEAEALVSSFGAIGGAMRREYDLAGERSADLDRDRMISEHGFMGSIRKSYRDSMSRGELPFMNTSNSSGLGTIGGNLLRSSFMPAALGTIGERGVPLLGAIFSPDTYLRARGRGGGMLNYAEEVGTGIGELTGRVETGLRDFRDSFAGIERDTFTAADASGLKDRFKLSERFGQRGGAAGGADNLSRNTRYLMGSSGSTEMMRVIQDASKEGATKAQVQRAQKVAAALKKGVVLRSMEEIDRYTGSASGADVREVLAAAGLGSPGANTNVGKYIKDPLEDSAGVTLSDVRVTLADRQGISKQMSRWSFISGGLGEEDMVAAMGDPAVESLRESIAEWVRAYDRDAIGGGEAAQKIGQRVIGQVEAINRSTEKPQYVKDFVRQMLRSAGITISGDTISATDDMLRHKEERNVMIKPGYEHFGAYIMGGEGRTADVQSKAKAYREGRVAGAAFDRGAKMFAGEFGIQSQTVGAGASRQDIRERSKSMASEIIRMARSGSEADKKRLVAIAEDSKNPMQKVAAAALNVAYQSDPNLKAQLGGELLNEKDVTELAEQTIVNQGSQVVEGSNTTGRKGGAGADGSQLSERKAMLDYMNQNTETLAAIARALNPDMPIPTRGT